MTTKAENFGPENRGTQTGGSRSGVPEDGGPEHRGPQDGGAEGGGGTAATRGARPDPKDPDAAAAHQFLSELRTRISTQPLPYQHGVEARALESLWEVFAQARAAMKGNPGCAAFAARTTRMLNVDLRPVTAKWHRAHAEGRLSSRDGANEFRADLEEARGKLREFAAELHRMAYGSEGEDAETPPAIMPAEVARLFADIRSGIPRQNGLIDPELTGRINETEEQAIALRRRHYGIPHERANAVGLGLSGGGIRSATFCLGVVQVLAGRGLLRDVDFLSTVSGGGYLGAFLTTAIRGADGEARVAAPRGPDTEPVRHLRRGAKYLAASNLKERWAMVTATLAGMVLNWTAPLFVVALAALVASLIPLAAIPWRGLMAALGGLTGVLLVVYAWRMRYQRYTGGRVLGLAIAVTLAVAGLWMLTFLYSLASVRIGAGIEFAGIAGLSAAVAAAFPAIARFVPIVRRPKVRRLVLKAALILAGLLVPLGAIALMLAFVYLAESGTNGRLVLLALTIGFGVVALLLLDINMTAPHRLYRDHLARTFVYENESTEAQDRSAGSRESDVPPAEPSTARQDVTWLPRREAAPREKLRVLQGRRIPNPVPLPDINPQGFAPYHLINATVNLPSSDSPALRERRSDFFLFSKGWCGAPSIGYAPAGSWRGGDGAVDLATAMAVSGAATSSHMGLGTVPSLRALLAFLNVRLGYWIRRPDAGDGFATPGFACLVREMLGIGMTEKSAWLNLSDGGHIENMGVYELLRRRCKFIVSIDGEADPQSNFHGHLTLVRHAQIDFGIRIEPDLTRLRPDAASRFSHSHSLMCRVHYPPVGADPGGVGLILYLKLSMTGDEIELVKRYRALNPDFPHQTTLDQFFDEEQFEAYRQLGVHVAEGLFHPAVLGGRKQPDTVAAWFRGLAGNLLLAEAEHVPVHPPAAGAAAVPPAAG